MKPFLYLVIVSALIISITAAVFSITGIATLFSGHFLQVAIMASSLEVGKIVLASLLYRYWNGIVIIHKIYMVVALLILMIITSAGIFGYLSESYQRTKSDYTLVEKEINMLNSKKTFFEQRKNRLIQDKELEIKTKISNQVRVDSLTARKQSIIMTRQDIKDSENKISNLENSISSIEDSIGHYELSIINLESRNIKGELGPLKYISDILNTEMDKVVKWFILLLIFVFDPLAISLIIASNMIYMKSISDKDNKENIEFTEHFSDKFKRLLSRYKKEKKLDDIQNLQDQNNAEVEDNKSNNKRPKITWKTSNWHD